MTEEKTAGIVCEYNPFHHGHAWHIEQTQKLGFKRIVCIMSGNFAQRGEPAILRKHIRAACAVRHGADLVLELPFPLACAGAEMFAEGATVILSATGIVDCLSFGSEEGSLPKLTEAAGILADESREYRRQFKKLLAGGLSYASARQSALHAMNPPLADVLSHPNNLLGITYLMAIRRHHLPLDCITVPRCGSGYLDPSLENRLASATAIRRLMMEAEGIASGQCMETLARYMPEDCACLAAGEMADGRCPVRLETLMPMILAILRRMGPEEVRRLPDVSEGLENRIHRASLAASTLAEFLTLAGSTRYTDARLRRILCHALVGMTKEQQKKQLQIWLRPDSEPTEPPSLSALSATSVHSAPKDTAGRHAFRVLAFSPHGRALMNRMISAGHRVVTGSLAGEIYRIRGNLKNMALKYMAPENRDPEYPATAARLEAYRLEMLSSDLYVLGYPDIGQQKTGMDRQPAVYIKSP